MADHALSQQPLGLWVARILHLAPDLGYGVQHSQLGPRGCKRTDGLGGLRLLSTLDCTEAYPRSRATYPQLARGPGAKRLSLGALPKTRQFLEEGANSHTSLPSRPWEEVLSSAEVKVITALSSGFPEMVPTFSTFSDRALSHSCLGRPGPTAHWPSKSAEGVLVCGSHHTQNGMAIITSVQGKSEESEMVLSFPLI